jgi:replicative DNA helicase
MTILEFALDYLDKGFSVFPVMSPTMLKNNPSKKAREEYAKKKLSNQECEEPLSEEEVMRQFMTYKCKQPLVPWKKYQTQLPTKEEVHHWFTMNPDANIGVITGPVSNLLVFDLDSQHAEEYAEENGGFPDTPISITGRGRHVWVKYPEGIDFKNSVNKNLDIDIRADGGFVVAPPSQHGSGNFYEWQEGYSLADYKLAPCNEWMMYYLEHLHEAPDKKKEPPTEIASVLEWVDTNKSSKKKESSENEIVEILKNGCSQGSRNHTATKVAGHLIKTIKNKDEAMVMLENWNLKNNPPLDFSELKSVFESVAAMEKKSQKEAAKAEEINIEALLDTESGILKEYNQNHNKIPFASNNLKTLANKMNGGLIGGRFYVLGGIPSAGKTALVNNIGDNICLSGYPVLCFSLDDGKSELRNRTIARFNKISIEELNNRRISQDDMSQKLKNQDIQKIFKMKYIVERSIDIEKWEPILEKIKNKHGKYPVIMIDYLRKIKSEGPIADERLRVDGMLIKLTDLAKKYNIPIIAISELARDSYKAGQRLSMASFKESGSIEYEASWLGVLAIVDDDNGGYKLKQDWEKLINAGGAVDLICFKAKRGTGFTGRIPLEIDKDLMTFTDRKNNAGNKPKKTNFD